jgi:Tfp pilus assembly protein PilO
MKFEMRFRPGDDVRVLWIAALVVLFGGLFYVQTRYETAISASLDRTGLLYRQTVADMRLVHQASHLRKIEREARIDLSHIARTASLSDATADLLTTLNGSAGKFDAHVVGVQPESGQSSADGLQANPVTIRVNGKFRNILRFVEDLSHHATLIDVSDTEMALANAGDRDAAEPHLDATIHATLYRLQRDPSEAGIAATR